METTGWIFMSGRWCDGSACAALNACNEIHGFKLQVSFEHTSELIGRITTHTGSAAFLRRSVALSTLHPGSPLPPNFVLTGPPDCPTLLLQRQLDFWTLTWRLDGSGLLHACSPRLEPRAPVLLATIAHVLLPAFAMPAKSRFTRLDAFTKTVEDARVRTTSGGIVTITSLLIVLYLVWGEWTEYRRIVVRPELVVDKGRGTSPP